VGEDKERERGGEGWRERMRKLTGEKESERAREKESERQRERYRERPTSARRRGREKKRKRAREKEHARKRRERPCCCTFSTQQYPVTRSQRLRLLTHPYSPQTLLHLRKTKYFLGWRLLSGQCTCVDTH